MPTLTDTQDIGTGWRPFLLASSGFIASAAALSAAATQFVAYRVGYHPAIGAPMFGHVYAPWRWLEWQQAPWASDAHRTFQIVDIGLLGVVAAVSFGGLILSSSIRRRPKKHEGVHGTARFQAEAEIRKSGLLPRKPGDPHAGAYVGGWTDRKGRTHYLRHDGPEHLIVIAPIGHDPSQHVAYVASWIKALEENPREVFRAAADAEKIVKLVRSYERGQEQASDNTQDAGGQQEKAMPLPSGPATRLPTMIRDTSPAAQAPSPERTYLAVPFAEKDDAKQLGAKWDRAEKAWFVPAGMDLEAFTPWMPAKGSVHIAVDTNPVEQFAEALRESGLQLDGAPQMDGQLYRVRAEGDHGAERSGAYRGHLDGRPAGFIQNHRTGVKQNWKASGRAAALDARDRAQMAAEAAQKRHDRAREREQQAERVAQQRA